MTPLRPGGKVQVDGQILDVVAEGEFVAPGEPVEIVRVEGPRIVVARTKR
jgi:membrane-bound serine protease (ClpP class)